MWTFQIKIQLINLVILMISENILLKNTLKPVTLEADSQFRKDLTLHRNVRF